MIKSAETAGFTLLEVLIAMLVVVLSFTSIILIQNTSLRSSERARQMSVVASLARQAMTETETLIQGKTFAEIKDEEKGQFKPPFDEYFWERKIKEVEFPQAAGEAEGGEERDGKEGNSQQEQMLTNLLTKYLSESIREVRVTVIWKQGDQEQKFPLASYWVNLKNDFKVSF